MAFAGWTILDQTDHDPELNYVYHFTVDFVRWVMILSGFGFFISAIPNQSRGLKSDGKRFLDLLGTGPAVQQERAVLALSFALMAGCRPRDLDPHLISQALHLGDASMNDIYARQIAASHASDLGDATRAQGYLDQVMQSEQVLPAFFADGVRATYAILIASHGGVPSVARAWLESAGAVEWDPSTRLTAEATVLFAEGHRSDAVEAARKALKALGQKPSFVRDQAQFETLQQLLAAATTAPSAASFSST
jgi:hypothetical protein